MSEDDRRSHKAVFFADEEGNIWKRKINSKLKKQWETITSDGYLIEWDEESQTFYRKDTLIISNSLN